MCIGSAFMTACLATPHLVNWYQCLRKLSCYIYIQVTFSHDDIMSLNSVKNDSGLNETADNTKMTN